ncbi:MULTISPECIES: Ohr family peroxiredoxin [unclassified Lysobacter]|uniref:Ohr family peroxiredoxin n=1 Tax=unclassified Lysobacter TaxID=2635362 RepID=UPI001C23A8EB|nr:Ohr family peroxiredoxin [Lysobacter sp. MMG2]MBU8976033.1 Ohr family peroxiredoxin [Lysobacter sp. MMG2]
MNAIDKILFTGKTHTTVNPPPSAADHGSVNLELTAVDGQALAFTDVAPHPTAEQLFAGAWSACYITAVGLVAAQKRVSLPADLSVDIEVVLGQSGAAWQLAARFDVRMPGVAQDVAEKIAHAAHQICPYSKAVHGNIDVAVNVTTS